MNIQIFGIKKSFDSKKAERFFKERGIKYQFVDMKEKGLSKGEFNSVRDTYQQLKTAQKKKDEVVQYKLGDAVTHPKFGHGIVEKINQRSGGVHLHIRFDGEVKCIDQKWLSRKKYM